MRCVRSLHSEPETVMSGSRKKIQLYMNGIPERQSQPRHENTYEGGDFRSGANIQHILGIMIRQKPDAFKRHHHRRRQQGHSKPSPSPYCMYILNGEVRDGKGGMSIHWRSDGRLLLNAPSFMSTRKEQLGIIHKRTNKVFLGPRRRSIGGLVIPNSSIRY